MKFYCLLLLLCVAGDSLYYSKYLDSSEDWTSEAESPNAGNGGGARSHPIIINVEVVKNNGLSSTTTRETVQPDKPDPAKTSDDDDVKISPDPDFMINMKLRQQERARKREAIRMFHKSKADEKNRLQLEEEANRIRAEREEQERIKEERRELRRKIKVGSSEKSKN